MIRPCPNTLDKLCEDENYEIAEEDDVQKIAAEFCYRPWLTSKYGTMQHPLNWD
jgi:hypothetical protein